MASWTWPVPQYSRITSKYGQRDSGFHEGLDFGATNGSSVLATRGGTVLKVDDSHKDNYGKRINEVRGYGNQIYIDHGDGYKSRYAHLAAVYVKEGQQISDGQLIGTVGSTGNSTGFHLHFEIVYKETTQDPEKYIDPSGPTIKNTPPISTTSSENPDIVSGVTNYEGVVDAGGITVGQRVSGITPQPVFAFINIYVGDNQLLLSTEPPRPNIIQSFEMTRLQDTSEEVIFTVFDDNWQDIETALSANHDKIYLQYGYYGTGLKSKIYKLKLLSYNLSFESTGTIISVEATTEGATDNLVQRSIVLNTKNPTEAVIKICEALGYKVYPENFDPSMDIQADDPFNIIEDYPLTYLYSTIIPQASQENEEIFTFRVDSDNVAYFKRVKYDSTKTDTLRTFIYQKGYDSNVLDFTVNINAVFGGKGDFDIATTYRSALFDKKTKSQSSYIVSKSSAITEATGEATATHSDQSNPIIDAAGYTESQIKSILYYNMKSRFHDAYEATLTIVGDPTITLEDRYIRVINVTDSGMLHHTSGIYWIDSITDSISSGYMTTSLKLFKNAAAGDIDGLEIINPKTLLK